MAATDYVSLRRLGTFLSLVKQWVLSFVANRNTQTMSDVTVNTGISGTATIGKSITIHTASGAQTASVMNSNMITNTEPSSNKDKVTKAPTYDLMENTVMTAISDAFDDITTIEYQVVNNASQLPAMGTNGVIYLAAIYSEVENPTGNPHDLGYYTLSNNVYTLTSDTSVQEGTTYYKKEDAYDEYIWLTPENRYEKLGQASIDISGLKFAGSATNGGSALQSEAIPFGSTSSTSSATAFLATVNGITELKDGTCLILKNTKVTSAAATSDPKCFTLDVNGLGAKKVYVTTAAATYATTQFTLNYKYLFVFDSSLDSGNGGWYIGQLFNTNDNTLAYNIRRSYSENKMYVGLYRYQICLTKDDDNIVPVYLPPNPTSTASSQYSTGTAKILTEETFNPWGTIWWYSTTTVVSAGSAPGTSYMWDMYSLVDIRYSFNTGSTLVANHDVFMTCEPQDTGFARLHNYIVKTPTTSNPKTEGLFEKSYQSLTVSTGNPKMRGWFKNVNNEYILAVDTSVVEGTTYYQQKFAVTTDTSVNASKTYYQKVNPITQELPTTDDGLIYVRLGRAYDTYRFSMDYYKPVYYFKDGEVRLWTNQTTPKYKSQYFSINPEGELDLVSGSITKSLLSSGVQASLNKADDAVQSVELNKYNSDATEGNAGTSAMGQTDVKVDDATIGTIVTSYAPGTSQRPYVAPSWYALNTKLAEKADVDDIAAYIDDVIEDKVDKVTSTDNAIARFDGTGGAIQNSGVIINDSNHVSAVKFISYGGTSKNFVKGDGSLDSSAYIKENAWLMPTNAFGGSSKAVQINLINNGFYAAHLRATVTLTGFTAGSAGQLFDGNYETCLTLPAGQTGVILIDSGNTALFGTYSYGYTYFSFYYNNMPDSISMRVYGTRSSGGEGWYDLGNATAFYESAGSYCYRIQNSGTYNCKKWEITIVAKSDTIAKPTQIDHQFSRGATAYMPVVTKFALKQDLWGDVEAPKFIRRGGTSNQFLKADGSVDSNNYVTLTSLNSALSEKVDYADGTKTTTTKQMATTTTTISGIAMYTSGSTTYTIADGMTIKIDAQDTTPGYIYQNSNSTILAQDPSGDVEWTNTTGESVVVKIGSATSGENYSIAIFKKGYYSTIEELTEKIEEAAASGVQADWNEDDSTDPAYIKNKPTVYTKPLSGIPKSDLANAVQTSLGKADSAVQDITITQSAAAGTGGTTIQVDNGNAYHIVSDGEPQGSDRAYKAPSWGAMQDYVSNEVSDKQDALVSGTNIKTINGNSVLGSGDLTLALGDENVQSDWNQTTTTADDYIKNKPTIPTALADLTEDSSHKVVSQTSITTWNDKAEKVTQVNHGTSDTTFTLTPNVLHVWGEVTSLTLTLGTGENGVVNEYMFQFYSGNTPTTLTLPNSVIWVQPLTTQAGKTYQVSIVNNLACYITDGMAAAESSGGTPTYATQAWVTSLIDSVPTANSSNVPTSGGTYAMIEGGYYYN